MITYRDAVPADGPALAAMARASFTETFGTLYRPQDLAAFLDQAFGPQGLPSQIGADTDWEAVATGDRFTCALKRDRTRWCFGDNEPGALGNGRAWLTELTPIP